MIITIARQLGSGGEEVGRLVAKRLGLLYADREILLRAARAGNLSELALVVDDERAPSLMERIASYSIRISSPNWRAEPLTPDQARILEGEYESHRHLVEQAIREIGKTNDGVIIGRGAQVILRHHPSALHVYLFAPEETRVERLAEREGISTDDAREDVPTTSSATSDSEPIPGMTTLTPAWPRTHFMHWEGVVSAPPENGFIEIKPKFSCRIRGSTFSVASGSR